MFYLLIFRYKVSTVDLMYQKIQAGVNYIIFKVTTFKYNAVEKKSQIIISDFVNFRFIKFFVELLLTLGTSC